MKIAVAKETRHNEKRVSIVPDVVKRLITLGAEVVVETGAGESAGFSDETYRMNGAIIANDKRQLYQGADVVSWVKRPEKEADELRHIPSYAMIVVFLDPFKSGNHLSRFAQKGVTTIALELLPRHKDTESMDALSTMGKFAGEIAYLNALTTVRSKAPIEPLSVLIVGSGNAGMAAAEKAHQDGNRLIVVSTNARYQSLIEERLSGVFVLLSNDSHQVLIEQQQQIQKVILTYQPDIIITTARRYGQKSPHLITAATIDSMKPGTVIEDLTASVGGNTPFTQADKAITLQNNVLIRHQSNYPSQEPAKASVLYAQCLWHLLKHVITQSHTEPNYNYNIASDLLLSKAVATHQGKVCFT